MEKVFEIVSRISTPLILGGFLAAIFFFITKEILRKDVFAELTKQRSYDIFKHIVDRLFFLSLMAVVFGFLGYIIPVFITAFSRSEASQTLERSIKIRVHRARFVNDLTENYFINVTNLSTKQVELTHVWYQDEKAHIAITHPSRSLPISLNPDQSWETWIQVNDVPEKHRSDPYENFHARISSGDIFHSERNLNVPPYGSVPGGPIDTR